MTGCCGKAAKATDSRGVRASSGCCGPKAPANGGEVIASSGCCGPKAPANGCDAGASLAEAPPVTHDDVSQYYGKTVTKQADLQTSACLLKGDLSAEDRRLMRNIHGEILEKFYGCGSPIPPLLEGLTVLVLGCGTGRDVYLVAQLVGPKGTVIGVDMTDEQLEVANKFTEWHREKFGFEKANTVFRKGFIEDLKAAGIEDSSVDVIISNCVINLAPDKAPVLSEVARVLKPGGELFFSDVFADRRIPTHLQKDKVLFGECLSGALYSEDFRRLMATAGLPLWGVVSTRELAVENPDISKKLGDISFYEATIRAVKLNPKDLSIGLDAPENYGQEATYLGGIPNHPITFDLDSTRSFPAGKAIPVDAATAAAIEVSRYGPFFTVTPPKEHRGLFTLWPKFPANVAGQVQLGGSDVTGDKADTKVGAGCCC